MNPLERSEVMKRQAEAILGELRLVERWSRYGRVSLVGALSFDLILTPDIDLEIYCPAVNITAGMTVLSECSADAHVVGALYQNELDGPDKAVYWRLTYLATDGVRWKIDMWSAPVDYDLPRGEDFVAPMRRALTPATRRTILELKAAREKGELPGFLSIDLYRAVLQDKVRTASEFIQWLETHPAGVLSDWKP